MAREKKDGKYMNLYIERNIAERFIRFCEQQGMPRSVAAQRAFVLYMKHMRFGKTEDTVNG